MNNSTPANNKNGLTPPRGLAILAVIGPSIIWAAEYIGSGEVIIATRTGAILGVSVLWAVLIGVFLKFWIGLSGARYTVCTGEGMIDMFDRMPGPRHWAVWLVLVVQFVAATISMGGIAVAVGNFGGSLTGINPEICGWIVAIFAFCVAWSGVFDVLKIVMSVLVLVIVIGVFYIAFHVFPEPSELLHLFTFTVPEVPQWASVQEGVSSNAWNEILPLLGWGAGGFASQVWYTYWVLGAGYGACAGRGYGQPADENQLKTMSRAAAEKIKGWCRVLYADSLVAMVIGVVVTSSFLIAGAGILGEAQLVPARAELADTLSRVFSTRWGEWGGVMFKLAGTAALISTLVGQLAGWPRLLADSVRLCFPAFDRRFSWIVQFRIFLVFFLLTNMIIVYTLGAKPVSILALGAVVDGLLLTSLQAACCGVGLYWVLPRLLSAEASAVLKPSKIFALGLLIAFLFFTYVCIIQIPSLFGTG